MLAWRKANGHDTLFSVYFKIGCLNFSNICCMHTLELPHRGNSNVHLQHIVVVMGTTGM